MRSISVALVLLAAVGTLAKAQEPTAKPHSLAIRFTYELPVAQQRTLPEGSHPDLEQLRALTMKRIQVRLGDDAVIEGKGATGFTVVAPVANAAERRAIMRRIESAGTLELRIVAAPARKGGVLPFDLAAERQRLQAWLDAGGKQLVQADVEELARWHLDPKKGPIAPAKVQWCVHRVRPRGDDRTKWERPLGAIPQLTTVCVPLFSDAELAADVPAATKPSGPPSLLELVALDLTEAGFTSEMFEPSQVAIVQTANGRAVTYGLQPAHVAHYMAWTDTNVGRSCALVWDGEVIEVPAFLSKVNGSGMLQRNLGEEQLENLAAMMRSGALPTEPVLVSIEFAK